MTARNENNVSEWDVIIIGGGPAGLSAALTLGRARRRVLVLDHRLYRNAASQALRGFITREGIKPLEFLQLAREGLKPYPNVHIEFREAKSASKTETGFTITAEGLGELKCRKLILATGVVDILPKVESAEQFIGKGLYHCPYCDGWEHKDLKIVAYGQSEECGVDFALLLSHWSPNIILCTDDFHDLNASARDRLKARNIGLREEKIRRFLGDENGLNGLEFANGEKLSCDAVFFNTTRRQSSRLAKELGCEGYEDNGCQIDAKSGKTNIDGLFIAGDASKDFLQVIVAAAEGTEAAMAINKELMKDEGLLPP